jgi:sterol desaturase/sphingolipid hydroxylase (fatty acid hydroxylase superfamily)
MTLTVMITLLLASSGAFMGVMMFAHAKLPGRRSFPTPERHLQGKKYLARVLLASIFSVVVLYELTFILADRLFYTRLPSLGRAAFDVVAILTLYDLMYYAVHRFLFHGWSVLMRVHAVHHQSHHPIPMHAMYLHPVENFIGLGLLLFSTWLLGPVNIYVFGTCFFVYSWLNIITHSGLALPLPYLGMLSRTHDAHHKHMRAGNYATLSPLPDMIFGTVE